MENIYLSDESYTLLKEFENKSPIPASELKQYQASGLEHLHKYGLIKYRTTSYDASGLYPIPKFSECSITEKGKDYLIKHQREQNTFETLKSMAASAEEQAKSAKLQAALAIQAAENAKADAKKAQREALFSKVIAIFSMIIALCSPFLSAYAEQIMEWLLKML